MEDMMQNTKAFTFATRPQRTRQAMFRCVYFYIRIAVYAALLIVSICLCFVCLAECTFALTLSFKHYVDCGLNGYLLFSDAVVAAGCGLGAIASCVCCGWVVSLEEQVWKH